MPDDADREIAQGCKDPWDGSGSDLGTVFVEGVVPNESSADSRSISGLSLGGGGALCRRLAR